MRPPKKKSGEGRGALKQFSAPLNPNLKKIGTRSLLLPPGTKNPSTPLVDLFWHAYARNHLAIRFAIIIIIIYYARYRQHTSTQIQ